MGTDIKFSDAYHIEKSHTVRAWQLPASTSTYRTMTELVL